MGFRCESLSKIYHSGSGNVHSIDQVSFQVEDSEFICIVGPSGCGKTTLLKLIAGLLEPTSGRVEIDDGIDSSQPLTAMVFQEQGLFPWMKVWENVAFGLEMQDVPTDERKTQSLVSLEKFGLTGFGDHYPHELSGGMKQRVALARAFLTNPKILLMDEPFRSLDDQTKLVLQAELLNVWKTLQQTVVYVTHDIEEAVILGDRILVMTGRPGRIMEEIIVPLERPRELTPETQATISETRWAIWKMLEDEVLKGVSEVL